MLKIIVGFWSLVTMFRIVFSSVTIVENIALFTGLFAIMFLASIADSLDKIAHKEDK